MKASVEMKDLKPPELRQWEQAAAGWNKHTPLIHQWLQLATDAMLTSANISTGMRVLDVAAGAGDQTIDIASRLGLNGSVVATDFSPAILTFAATRASDAGLHNVETCVANAEDLPMGDASFDAAVCRLGLMLMVQPSLALSEIRRVLKPQGRLSALVFSDMANNPCLRILMSVALARAGLPPSDPYRPGSLFSLGKPGVLTELFSSAGFSQVVTTRLAAPIVLPSARHYLDFVRDSGAPVVAVLAHLDNAARADAWADIEKELDAFSTPNGWRGPNELTLVTGVK